MSDTGNGVSPEAGARAELDPLTHIPEQPISRQQVRDFLSETARRQDALAQAGRVSGSIYHGGAEHFSFLGEVATQFSHMNVLQRDMYPAATRFESEIIAMTAAMLHGGPDVCGSVTSGGTESIVTAVLAYRNAARERRGESHPELVVAETAHPAFEKACHYFGVRLVRVKCEPVGEVDIRAMRRAITPAHDRARRIGRGLRLRRRRRHLRAGAGRAGARDRPACRRLPGRVHPAVAGTARRRHPGLRLPRSRRVDDLGRHAQVRLCAEGQLRAPVRECRAARFSDASSRQSGRAGDMPHLVWAVRVRMDRSRRPGRR